MKIFGKSLSILAISATVFTSVASADSGSPPTIPDLNSIKEVHQYVVDNGFASLNNDGTLSVTTAELQSYVDPALLEEYQENIADTNQVVLSTGGAIKFDKNYDLHIGTTEEVADGVYQTDQLKQSNDDTPVD